MSPFLNEVTPIEGWLLEQYSKQACDDPWSIERYPACRLLKESGIPCYLWAEDALAYYGVPTVVFDVHIVVGDVKKAADALVERGWHPPPPDFEARYSDIEEATCYLVKSQCESVGPLWNTGNIIWMWSQESVILESLLEFIHRRSESPYSEGSMNFASAQFRGMMSGFSQLVWRHSCWLRFHLQNINESHSTKYMGFSHSA